MWYNAPWNGEIIKFVQSFSSPFMDNLFEGITMLGEEYFFVLVLTAIYWCIDKRLGYKIGFTFLSGTVLNTGIKQTLRVPRPIGEPGIRSLRIETATGWSFPSGHTQLTTTFWTSLMVNVKRNLLRAAGVIIIPLVGISRLYLGVHRPIDVFAGIILGTTWVLVINRLFKYIEGGGSRWILALIMFPTIIALFLLQDEDLFKASGIFFGFFVGYIVEPIYIDFEEKGSPFQQFLKMVIGISGVIIIRMGLKLVLPEGLFSELIRYFLIGIWVTLGATYIFKKNLTSKTSITA